MRLEVFQWTYFIRSRDKLPRSSIIDRATDSYPVMGVTTTCILGVVSEGTQQLAAR